jgi:hypothetical protein
VGPDERHVARLDRPALDEAADRRAVPVGAPDVVPIGEVQLGGQLNEPDASTHGVRHARREGECHVVIATQDNRKRPVTHDPRGGAPAGLASPRQIHRGDGQVAYVDQPSIVGQPQDAARADVNQRLAA